jgi:hypothetical protein
VDGKDMLFLRTRNAGKGRISLLNTHTYSQADFDAVGEVLLCPRDLDLLSMGEDTLSRLRAVFGGGFPGKAGPRLAEGRARAGLARGPSGVTFHPFSATSDDGFVIQNFNVTQEDVNVITGTQSNAPVEFVDRFSGQVLSASPVAGLPVVSLEITIPARGRIWIQPQITP